MARLRRSFFNRPTVTVARQLLGCYLVRRMGNRVIRVRIIETEAYVGPKDKASHASRGSTPRTQVMFGKAGCLYIYLVYGMYYCLNVVTEREGYPAAVLIRSSVKLGPSSFFVPYGTKNEQNGFEISGPGRVCRALKIDKRLHGEDSVVSRQLWFEKGKLSQNEKIMTGKRIGIPYAGRWQHKRWRFYIKKPSDRTIHWV